MLNNLFGSDTPERENGLVHVAKLKDLVPGELKKVIVTGQAIALTQVRREEREGGAEYDVVAFSAICPHSLGDLSQGWVVRDEVDCPIHYYRYNLRSGACTYPQGGPKLHLYPVTIDGDNVYVKVVLPKWMDVSNSESSNHCQATDGDTAYDCA
jgi:nitrite reductase/ring-hydroxylating ferredoxin subunit